MSILPFVSWFTRKLHICGVERVLRFFYSPDKRADDFFETSMDYEGGKIQINTSSFIEWVTYFRGHYEPRVTRCIGSIITPDSISIDVGANIGLHTIEMARGKRVYAFEPNPFIYQRLQKNLALSKLNNVDTFQCGISREAGYVDFFIHKANNPHKGLSSVYQASLGESDTIKIKVDTIDNIFGNLERLDVIKIDIEGNDFNAILGAEKTIDRLRPIIIFEWCDKWEYAHHTFADAQAFFASKHYVLETIDGKPIMSTKGFEEVVARPQSVS